MGAGYILTLILGLAMIGGVMLYVYPMFGPKQDSFSSDDVVAPSAPLIRHDIQEMICEKDGSDNLDCEPRTRFGDTDIRIPDDIKKEIDTEEIAQLIHKRVNLYRAAHALSELGFDSDLAGIAKAHADEMAENRYLSHLNLESETPTNRGQNAGYECERQDGIIIYSGIGENIAYSFAHQPTITYVNDTPMPDWITQENRLANGIFEQWRTSPPHNENMLTEEYLFEGVGVALNEHGELYSVQNLVVCQP